MSRNNTIPYGAIFLASVTLSIGGVLCAAYISCLTPEDGTRGGALAVATSFAALFVSRTHGTFQVAAEELEKLDEAVSKFELLLEKKPSGVNELTAEQLFERWKSHFKETLELLITTDAHDQNIQNWFLAASSILGTIFWGFGDWFVDWIRLGKICFPPS